MITYEQIKADPVINTYIESADKTLIALGYTEHSFAHVARVAETARYILETLGYPPREVELARIAGHLHDIGNIVNRIDHAQTGALMAFQILNGMGVSPSEIAAIVTAIGNHDEETAVPVDAITAALILGDKTDVRRSRVRNTDTINFDIHDRVNYSAMRSATRISADHKVFELNLTIDTAYGSVMDYFEIFLDRMILCRKAAAKLGMNFRLIMNNQQVM